jgi:predicted RNase H-like nuclease (RuvC/YqgF family)
MEYAKIFTETFNRELMKNRLAVIETELENLSANMLADIFSSMLMKMLAECEAEKTQLESRLAQSTPIKPNVQILPHPKLVRKLREKIDTLREALNDESIRIEAAERKRCSQATWIQGMSS